MKVLSIDWDYFYGDQTWFDWQMNEDNPIYYEIIWGLRAGNTHIRTGESAITLMQPNQRLLKGFWDRVPDAAFIFVAESHRAILDSLGGIIKHVPLEIWNVDAHHDCGYPGSGTDKPHCGNWAAIMGKRLKVFHQIYPGWRRKCKEPTPIRTPDQILYKLPEKFDVDAIFICRSSCWTPSWCDDQWLNFIGGLDKFNSPMTIRKQVDWVMKARHPNMEEARKLEAQYKIFMEANFKCLQPTK